MKIFEIFLAISWLLVQGQAQDSAEKVNKVLGHHRGPIIELAIMANEHLASASTDGTVKMWNAVTGKFVKTIYTGSVSTMEVLPNGDIACGSSHDNSIQVWDAVDGTLVKSMPNVAPVNDLVVLPDGNLASASDDNSVVLWNLATGQQLAALRDHSMPVTSLAVLSLDKLVSASKDKTIKIWSLTSKTLLRSINSRNAHAIALTTLPDGRIVAGFDDGSISVWNSNDGSLLDSIERAHDGKVVALSALPEEGFIASGGAADKSIKVWNLDDGPASLNGQLSSGSSEITRFVRLGNGDLAVAFKDGTMSVWNAIGRSMKRVIGGLRFSAKNLLTLADGDMACSDGPFIHIWSPVDDVIIKTFNAGSEVTSLANLPNGDFASGAKDGAIKRWNKEKLVGTGQKHTAAVTKLVILPDGYLASASEDMSILIWDTTPPRLIQFRKLTGQRDTVSSLTVLPNGYLASASKDQSIWIWNLQTDKPKPIKFGGLPYPIGEIVAIDENRLAVSYKAENEVAKKVYIFNMPNDNVESKLTSHFGAVTTMTVLPNGYLATGSIDGTIKVWNVERQELMATFAAHTKALASLEVLLDGQLVSSSSDELVTWDLDMGARCEFYGILTTANLRCNFNYNFEAERLELNGKNIRSISSDAFGMFRKVRELQLGTNQLLQLEPGTFSSLLRLHTLYLFDNQLSDFDGKLFESLSGLSTLNLAANRLSQLPKDLFKYTPALADLNLQDNFINDLDVSVFEQVCLRKLNLANNPVERHLTVRFNGKCLQVFDKRQYVDLSSSLLVSLGYENKAKAYAVEITNKNLNSIDSDALSGYRSTRILDLSSNALETLAAGQFSEMESLEELSLTRNQLETVPDNLFTGLTGLLEVRLNRNFLTKITENAFVGLEDSVERIDLRDNQIVNIDRYAFYDLRKLKRIYLKGNPIATHSSADLSQLLCGQRCLVIV